MQFEQTDCQGEASQGTAGCEDYAEDLYEHLDYSVPLEAQTTDVQFLRTGYDSSYYYLELDFVADWDGAVSTSHQVVVEIDVDANTESNRGDYYVGIYQKSEFNTTSWVDAYSDGGYEMYRDANNDVGGATPLSSDFGGSEGDGYESGETQGTDKVWARIVDGNFQVAIERSAVGNPARAYVRSWSRQSTGLDKGALYFHDHQSAAGISQIDNTAQLGTKKWIKVGPGFPTPDIKIDCDFTDWCDGDGTDFCVDDQGGQNDWTSPAKLDITRFGIASNLIDDFYLLFGFDDVPPVNSTASVLIDTDLDDNADFMLGVIFGGGDPTVQLYSCDNSSPYGCGGAVLDTTYGTDSYCAGTAAGPWDNDTFVEVALAFIDVGSPGNVAILSALISYNPGFWNKPKDSILGALDQDYFDRFRYDTENGTGEIIEEAGDPLIWGTLYSDEGLTDLGPGRTVRLLINGTDAGTDTTDAVGGYLFSSPAAAGDAAVVFIHDDVTYRGTTVTVLDGANLGDYDMYAGHVLVRHDNGGSLTNSDMNDAKGAFSDADILYSISGGDLTVLGSGTELYVPSDHGFAPAGNVTTPNMENRGTFDGGSAAVVMNGTLTLSDGSFTATSDTTSITGDLTRSGGTFNHNSGTVTLNGSGQSISGSMGFYNLRKSATSADTITFEAASTQAIAGQATLEGGAGNLLSLVSDTLGSRWNFTVNTGATKAISYVEVSDSDASSSDVSQKPINPTNSVDAGNNVDWFPVLSVSLSNSTFTFGHSPLDAWLTPDTSVITNDGTVAEDFVGRISQFTDGVSSWGISSSANGIDTVRAQWSTTSESGPWTDMSAYDTDFTVATNVAVDDSVSVWFRIQTPTASSSYEKHSSTLTVTAQQY